MRHTCLKCGNQIELVACRSPVRICCVCGEDYTFPEVVNTGIRPDAHAAERSRHRAFRAAGLVKNVGGFAFGISLLGILFFPLGLLGAAVGIYVVTMLRGPVGRYSGRKQAVLAIGLGVAVFVIEGIFALGYLEERRLAELRATQRSAEHDLRALLRAQRLFRASNDTYGTFSELSYRPRYGRYSIYLGADDLLGSSQDGETRVSVLPQGLTAGVTESRFTAIAVADLDDDPALDVWRLTDAGATEHLVDDALSTEPFKPPDPPTAPPAPKTRRAQPGGTEKASGKKIPPAKPSEEASSLARPRGVQPRGTAPSVAPPGPSKATPAGDDPTSLGAKPQPAHPGGPKEVKPSRKDVGAPTASTKEPQGHAGAEAPAPTTPPSAPEPDVAAGTAKPKPTSTQGSGQPPRREPSEPATVPRQESGATRSDNADNATP